MIDDDPAIARAKAIASLVASREVFDSMRPLFEQMVAAARSENAYYLAFAASHMLDSIDVFMKQVDRYIEERVKGR